MPSSIQIPSSLPLCSVFIHTPDFARRSAIVTQELTVGLGSIRWRIVIKQQRLEAILVEMDVGEVRECGQSVLPLKCANRRHPINTTTTLS